jgi:hypothetical protein
MMEISTIMKDLSGEQKMPKMIGLQNAISSAVFPCIWKCLEPSH